MAQFMTEFSTKTPSLNASKGCPFLILNPFPRSVRIAKTFEAIIRILIEMGSLLQVSNQRAFEMSEGTF